MIWHHRQIRPKPWTEDQILRNYKFCNVFRELDKGTLALRELYKFCKQPEDWVFTTCWYRLYNLDYHANHWIGVGCLPTWQELLKYIRNKAMSGHKVFTSAHMTHGSFGENKIDTYERSIMECWNDRNDLLLCCEKGKMELVFERLKDIYCIGPFIAYEIVCDLRFTPVLEATDRMSWANLGPGCKRGLQRLGLPLEIRSLIGLYERTPEDVLKILGKRLYELREVEHCLCEFDKYERARLGQGRPRQRYDGSS